MQEYTHTTHASFFYRTFLPCRLVSIDLNVCKKRKKWSRSVWSEVHILAMSQRSALFLTQQGWYWVKRQSPCALMRLDESYRNFVGLTWPSNYSTDLPESAVLFLKPHQWNIVWGIFIHFLKTARLSSWKTKTMLVHLDDWCCAIPLMDWLLL